MQSKAYPGADCGSDHIPVMCSIRVNLRKMKRAKKAPEPDYESLNYNPEIKFAYAVSVQNRFEALMNDNGSNWNSLRNALASSAKDVLPQKEKNRKNKWITKEILDMMEKRRQVADR